MTLPDPREEEEEEEEEVTELIRAREVALSLQEAMLPAPRPAGDHRAAVRYRPATGALNVGGDWYDLAGLPGGRIAVAVGDAVGHGLPAAGVMGQRRSALSAASRVADGPAPNTPHGARPASRSPRAPSSCSTPTA